MNLESAFKRILLLAVALYFLLGSCVAQGQKIKSQRRLLRFEDYRVSGTNRKEGAVIGIPRSSHEESSAAFNRRIRQAARRSPNFAGHYAIVGWSCGSILRQLCNC